MSAPDKKPNVLDEVVREAKRAKTRDMDFDAIEEKLFSRIAAESANAETREKQASRESSGGLRWGFAAAGLAMAAGVALFVGRPSTHATSTEDHPLAVADPTAGSVGATHGSGAVTKGGVALRNGATLITGDEIVASNARATIDRPGKVTWAIDGEGEVSRVRVKQTSGPIVLALGQGSVEADVVKVPSGEAFAVDLETATGIVRVAVHGTHLRVTRNGRKAIIDLTEGIVSIGHPPRTGSTYGTLVTAPAHVELDPDNLEAGVTVDHSPASVRAALDLKADLRTNEVAVATPFAAHESPEEIARAAPEAPPAVKPRTQTPSEPQAPEPPARDPNASETVSNAVRACMASHLSMGLVKVTVSTALTLHVNADGVVDAARFNPPLAPDVQTCAAETIYKTRFVDGGDVRIPLELR